MHVSIISLLLSHLSQNLSDAGIFKIYPFLDVSQLVTSHPIAFLYLCIEN
jgi:hypothetical protein